MVPFNGAILWHVCTGLYTLQSTFCLCFLMHCLYSVYVDHRVSKTIDVGHSFVVEMPDLCTVPVVCTAAKSLPDHFVTDSTFSVEIKVCCQ